MAAGGSQFLLAKDDGRDERSWSFQFEGNRKVNFQVRGTTADNMIAGSDVADQAWHHWAGAYDGSSMRIYRDGVEVASIPSTGPITPSAARVLIGRRAGQPQECFRGLVDEVRIYRRGLSGREIAELAAGADAGE